VSQQEADGGGQSKPRSGSAKKIVRRERAFQDARTVWGSLRESGEVALTPTNGDFKKRWRAAVGVRRKTEEKERAITSLQYGYSE